MTPTGRPTTTVVVMGVSGSGKTTVARELARRRDWVFAEGDEFHPPENVAKMSRGTPLDDDDRRPWLRLIGDWIGEQEHAGRSAVVTCSALKRAYRDLLREGHPSVVFAHVDAPEAVLADRLARRKGHYMPPSLLPSQLATLEPLQDDEPGVVVDATEDPAEVVGQILRHLTGAPATESGGAR